MSILDEEDRIINSSDRVILLQQAKQWFEENCGEEVLSPGEDHFPSPLISNPSCTSTDGISTKIELEYDVDTKKIIAWPINYKYFLYIKNDVIIPSYIDISRLSIVYIGKDGTRYLKDDEGNITFKTTIFKA